MIQLLVGVDVGCLGEHLLRLLSKLILFVHRNTGLHLLDIALLSNDFTVCNCVLSCLVFLLERALILQVEIGTASAETIGL